ncbi:hypothetical protein ACLOJK_013250 [Asimina triloba]
MNYYLVCSKQLHQSLPKKKTDLYEKGSRFCAHYCEPSVFAPLFSSVGSTGRIRGRGNFNGCLRVDPSPTGKIIFPNCPWTSSWPPFTSVKRGKGVLIGPSAVSNFNSHLPSSPDSVVDASPTVDKHDRRRSLGEPEILL